MTWQALSLDLAKATPAMFKEFVAAFAENAKMHPLPKLTLTDGWHTITPQLAETLLRHNALGANRKPSLTTVQYYAGQMVSDDWKKTGQPVIISDNDSPIDGQHRLYACYLTGKSFESYVVTNVPHFENLFAYIDNGKARTVTDALSTAGFNGRASVIGQVLRIARNYDGRAYSPLKTKSLPKITPAEACRYVAVNTAVQQIAHLQLGEYESATSVIGHKDVAIFCAWKIQDTFGDEVLDDFMTAVGSGEPVAKGNPIGLLREKLRADKTAERSMSKGHVLGHVIMAFNAWHANKMVKSLILDANGPFPRFPDKQEPMEEAA